MIRPIGTLALSVTVLLALSACGPSEAEKQAQAQAQAQARSEAAAEKHYQDFRQLMDAQRSDLALSLADYLVATHPQTRAAARIKAELEPLRAQVEEERETRRLQALWVYHDEHDAKAGGRVRSAYIFARDPIGPATNGEAAPRARLVLRRHPQWGDDVYLLSDRGHFSCASPCRLKVSFEPGQSRTVPGEIPPTGEPAIFVRDFKGFIRDLPQARTVSIEAVLKEGGPQTLHFEVGGYQGDKIGS